MVFQFSGYSHYICLRRQGNWDCPTDGAETMSFADRITSHSIQLKFPLSRCRHQLVSRYANLQRRHYSLLFVIGNMFGSLELETFDKVRREDLELWFSCLHFLSAGITGICCHRPYFCRAGNHTRASCILDKHSANWAASPAWGQHCFKSLLSRSYRLSIDTC